jgi:CBS domain-containing protein
MDKTCDEVMTADPTFCVPSDTAKRAAQLLRDLNVGAIPVCESAVSKKLIGILTGRDLVRKVVAEGRDSEATLVNDIMTTEVFACRPDDHINCALETMERQHVKRMPVVDQNQCLVGIIARVDLAARLRHDTTQDARKNRRRRY